MLRHDSHSRTLLTSVRFRTRPPPSARRRGLLQITGHFENQENENQLGGEICRGNNPPSHIPAPLHKGPVSPLQVAIEDLRPSPSPAPALLLRPSVRTPRNKLNHTQNKTQRKSPLVFPVREMKGLTRSEMKIPSLFIRPRIVLKPYDFISFMEHNIVKDCYGCHYSEWGLELLKGQFTQN